MSAKKEVKVSLSAFFLAMTIIIIVIMGFFMFELYKDKQSSDNLIEELTSLYISNFSKSVFDELGEGNYIQIELSNYNGYIQINNKHEAYIYLPSYGYSDTANQNKIVDNVVNAWYCEQGQVSGNEYIIFLKEDGSVTYVRFRTDALTEWKTIFESEEKVLENVTDICDIITIEGNAEKGIGGYGVLLIKEDGNCVPYFVLE